MFAASRSVEFTFCEAGLFLATWSLLQEQRAEDEEARERYRMKVGPDGKAISADEAAAVSPTSASQAAA